MHNFRHQLLPRLANSLSQMSLANILLLNQKNCKLIKLINISFKQSSIGQAPDTIIDFYRIGKVLDKEAFGKVNLGYSQAYSIVMCPLSRLKSSYSIILDKRKKSCKRWLCWKRPSTQTLCDFSNILKPISTFYLL